MSWDWVDDYPIFIYTTFINNGVCKVKIVKGERFEQNAEGYGPTAVAWKEYIEIGLMSKKEVVEVALDKARKELNKEKLNVRF
jgi:hypothetical protein